MGAFSGVLGLAGGAAGTGFATPQSANIQMPTTVDQAKTAYGGTQDSMQSQQALLQALQGQNGIQNQSNVYGQLQNVAAGQGPNPAQAMLNQSTGQNVANQAALMAGQRGASGNVGLMARQAAQQGAGTQQQSVGQAASLQAQQSLNALGAAGNLATTQAGQQIGQTNANTAAQQAEQQALLNSISQQNNANVGMQSNVNQGNTALAGATMGIWGAAAGGLGSGAGAAGAAAAAAQGGDVKDDSVESPKMAEGGITPGAYVSPSAASGPQSMFGQFLANNNQIGAPSVSSISPSNPDFSGITNAVSSAMKPKSKKEAPTTTGIEDPWEDGGGLAGGPSDTTDNSAPISPGAGMAADSGVEYVGAKGGEVKALVSPEEIYLTPEAVEKVRAGADPMHVGERIGGKPKVGGAVNSYANDVVPKTLKSGGIVIPRSETKSKNPSENSKQFVDSVLAKRKVKGS